MCIYEAVKFHKNRSTASRDRALTDNRGVNDNWHIDVTDTTTLLNRATPVQNSAYTIIAAIAASLLLYI